MKNCSAAYFFVSQSAIAFAPFANQNKNPFLFTKYNYSANYYINNGASNLKSGASNRRFLASKLNFEAQELGLEAQELSLEAQELGFEAQELGFEAQELGLEAQELGFEAQELGLEAQELGLELKNCHFAVVSQFGFMRFLTSFGMTYFIFYGGGKRADAPGASALFPPPFLSTIRHSERSEESLKLRHYSFCHKNTMFNC